MLLLQINTTNVYKARGMWGNTDLDRDLLAGLQKMLLFLMQGGIQNVHLHPVCWHMIYRLLVIVCLPNCAVALNMYSYGMSANA